LKKF
jgi:hypothetical protein